MSGWVESRALRDDGFTILNFTEVHAREVRTLVAVHSDPFDRALIAQALAESMAFITHDRHLSGYGSFVHLI